jgi:putative endonuclease
MFFVYILYSVAIDHYYVGHSEDLEQRLVFHLSGKSPYTSRARDWKLVYFENYPDKKDAIKRELGIKWKKEQEIYRMADHSEKDGLAHRGGALRPGFYRQST